jgi:urease accessory protein
MFSSAEGAGVTSIGPNAGLADLHFAWRGGRTVLTNSRLTAPMMLVRPFDRPDGSQIVQLITLGPGLCGGDAVRIRIVAESGANVVVTTTAATRVLSMRPGARAEQHIEIAAHDDATIQYYPLVTIPFPDSAFVQTVSVGAAPGSRVGVLEVWALGRTARDEYLRFRSLSNRTTLQVDGAPCYVDATDLRPDVHDLTGAGVLAGRRYLASGFWYGATIADEACEGASSRDLLIAFAQSRPGLAYLRALADDALSLDSALRTAAARIAACWGHAPLILDRFRC